MKEKILTPYLKNVLESSDFKRAFYELKENAIDKGREGLFGIVKHLNSEDYLFSPSIYLGSEGLVSRYEGLKYAKENLGEKYSSKSINKLVNSPEFIEDCNQNGIPIEIPLDKISRAHNWNLLSKKDYDFADEFFPFLNVHNHPNVKKIKPSGLEGDIGSGYAIARSTEGNDFYSLIFGDNLTFSKNIWPFLLMKFEPRSEFDEKITEEKYKILVKKMGLEFDKKFGDSRTVLLNALFNQQIDLDTNELGFDWNYCFYDLRKRQVW